MARWGNCSRALAHHLHVLSVDALKGAGGGVVCGVGILLIFLFFREEGSLLSSKILNKVLNGVALILTAAETVEIKFLQLSRRIFLTITLKNNPFPLFFSVLASSIITVLVRFWDKERRTGDKLGLVHAAP